MNTDKLTWYAARSGGIVAWCVLALSLILGLVLSSRILGRRVSPAWTLSVHRFLGGLGVAFTAVHVAAIVMDDFVAFGIVDVLVPWASEWKPSAVAWGIVAMYLMLAIELTSFAMRRLPKRLWRGVHWMSGPLFVTATLHGLQAGTDTGRLFVQVTLAVIAVLSVLTTVRVIRARTAREHNDVRAGAAAPVQPAGMRRERPVHVLAGLTLANPPAPTVRTKRAVSSGHMPAGSLAEALPRVPDSPAALVDGLTRSPSPPHDAGPFLEALAGQVGSPGPPAAVTVPADEHADAWRPGPVPGVWKHSARGASDLH